MPEAGGIAPELPFRLGCLDRSSTAWRFAGSACRSAPIMLMPVALNLSRYPFSA